MRCEVHSAKGRADCVVETREYVYVFEFKLDDSAEVALEQIDRRGYARPCAADPRAVMRVGASFSSEEHNIAAWKVLSGGPGHRVDGLGVATHVGCELELRSLCLFEQSRRFATWGFADPCSLERKKAA